MNKEKDAAYYSACFEAWIANRMEGDRTLVALSAGAVGVLLTIVSLVEQLGRWSLVLFGVSGLLFVVVIVSGVYVFRWNSDLLEAEVGLIKPSPKQRATIDRRLVIVERVMRWGFMSGVVMAFALGLQMASTRIEPRGEEKMDGNRIVKPITPGGTEERGLQGIENLRPSGGATPSDSGSATSPAVSPDTSGSPAASDTGSASEPTGAESK